MAWFAAFGSELALSENHRPQPRASAFAYQQISQPLSPKPNASAGLEERKLYRLANLVATAGPLLSFYCMGLNQSTVGMWKNNSLINLHLLTGQIGKPGAGPFSLTGQPNAMGGREAGLLSHQLPGYRTVLDAEHRRHVETYWGRRPGTIRPEPGLTAVEMFRALERGQLKAIWIAGTNPAVSLPDLHHVMRGLERAQLVVVQDAYHPTETTRLADVLLPAAQWGEKEWTSTNSERTISYSPKLFDPPGVALPDWQIVARFARTLGFQGFGYSCAGEVWDEFIGLTPGRPCDMAGATSTRLRTVSSLQWPCPTPHHPGSKRLYLDRKFATPSGRAIFLLRDHREPRELPDHEFPFVLTTGRLYAHWHTLTRTAKSEKLMRREPGPFVEVNPLDAERLQLGEGELVQVSSRRGAAAEWCVTRDGICAFPLGRPLQRRKRCQLFDHQRDRPRCQTAGAEILCGQLGEGRMRPKGGSRPLCRESHFSSASSAPQCETRAGTIARRGAEHAERKDQGGISTKRSEPVVPLNRLGGPDDLNLAFAYLRRRRRAGKLYPGNRLPRLACSFRDGPARFAGGPDRP
jgi:hypothetical protein